ncbi:hypothetical protein [Streptomyces sp. G-5]|uniref:hypothetical protein n=1 Tax=Streptomyces sp. G-5 TaxID=2977231 RepID=UPI0021CDF884|nr:hypothetical protein [Streptomyces sp. G-5]MCU4750269.1 hypothetical protein [Streptomyces sp. G-5]
MQVKPAFLTPEFEASGRFGYLLTRVLEGDGTVSDIRRLANLDSEDRIRTCVTAHGRAYLSLLKKVAQECGLPHVLDVLQRYGHWYASHVARGGCIGCRS